MDNFKTIYRILESDMDKQKCDISRIAAEQLGVSEERWLHYIEMLSDSGHIKGARIAKNLAGDMTYSLENMKITMSGLEYLHENSTMQKIMRAEKGIKDVIPGM